MALHEHRVQRPVKIVPRADAGRFDRRQRVEHRTGTDRNPGRAQGAGEVNDVFGEAAGLLRHGNSPLSYSAALSSARTSSISSFALVPSRRAMSS